MCVNRNKFDVTCQHCDDMFNLYDLAFEDNKINGNLLFCDGEEFDMICPLCGKSNTITPKAKWEYDVEKK